ncbi:ABC transporter substrate-binding protein [Croceivirga sp. JEA036]|uniref:ABC transporter substrate-binding protein n=1 Tax=Croceivirga sp. JEA036 TaxID=2721162 RepID=UPI00143956FA|nr:ABC transporter substrate-binding protein [Croceivirga sp. JEA036]NJB37926.1 ABC transporter substrate-binding protein [Croceivirga sp. JEA036]
MKRTFTIPLFALAIVLFFNACKSDVKKEQLPTNSKSQQSFLKVAYADGFSIDINGNYPIIKVNKPWPGAEQAFTYAVIPDSILPTITFPADAYDAVITTPIKKLVVTSTTHIPALESLGELDKLVGFPDTKYISSMPARERIKKGLIKELGQNEKLNTEMTIALQPDVIIGFSIDNQNSTYSTLEQANIPVVYNGDWAETHPLGKAEWIKFFGVLLGKEKQADSIFTQIAKDYNATKKLAQNKTNNPTVISGALYKDVWYMPTGESWAAKFIADAGGNYLYRDTKGNGSLALSVEAVLQKGTQADYWIGPAQFTAYQEMNAANPHYQQFKAFTDKKVYTFSNTKGLTGGLLYYELAPQRPDLVLKDLVHWLHPDLLPNYNPYFFTPLR